MNEGVQLLRSAVGAEFEGRSIIASLATVDADGWPRVRSVVCRRIDLDGGVWIAADARSAKMAQLLVNDRVELCVWLPRHRQQFRVGGAADVLTDADGGSARVELWKELPDSTRVHLLWPSPGMPRSADSSAFPVSFPAGIGIPPAFAAILARPDQIELLELDTHPHRRRRWRLANQWRLEEVNP